MPFIVIDEYLLELVFFFFFSSFFFFYELLNLWRNRVRRFQCETERGIQKLKGEEQSRKRKFWHDTTSTRIQPCGRWVRIVDCHVPPNQQKSVYQDDSIVQSDVHIKSRLHSPFIFNPSKDSIWETLNISLYVKVLGFKYLSHIFTLI